MASQIRPVRAAKWLSSDWRFWLPPFSLVLTTGPGAVADLQESRIARSNGSTKFKVAAASAVCPNSSQIRLPVGRTHAMPRLPVPVNAHPRHPSSSMRAGSAH